MIKKISALFALSLTALCPAWAQTTLNDFSNFVQINQTSFFGTWSDGSSEAPAATFSQGAGTYSLIGGTNDESSGVYSFFETPVSILDAASLSLTAQLLAGNTATELTVSLYDVNDVSATAVFDLGSLSNATFLSTTALLNVTGGFNATQVSYFVMSGATFGGVDTINLSLDKLSAGTSAIPEPSTYALMAGAAGLGLAIYRRQRRTA